MKKILALTSALSHFIAFLMFTLFSVISLVIVHSADYYPPSEAHSSREEKLIKGYELFFGSSGYNNNHSILGIVLFILFIILILSSLIIVFLKNEKQNIIISFSSLLIGLAVCVILIYIPVIHVSIIKSNETVILGSSTFISNFSCKFIYHIVILLLCIGLICKVALISDAKFNLVFNSRFIISSIVFVMIIIGTILISLSQIEYRSNPTNDAIVIKPIQEFLGFIAVKDANELKFRTVIGLAYLSLLMIIPLALTNIFFKYDSRTKASLAIVQSILGLFFGFAVIFAYKMNNRYIDVDYLWTIGGIIIIAISIFSLFYNVISEVDNGANC